MAPLQGAIPTNTSMEFEVSLRAGSHATFNVNFQDATPDVTHAHPDALNSTAPLRIAHVYTTRESPGSRHALGPAGFHHQALGPVVH